MHWQTKISILSTLLIPIVLVGILLIWVFKPFQKETAMESDQIFEEAPQVGTNGHRLLPNLKGSQIVAPDRPHEASEIHPSAPKLTKEGKVLSQRVKGVPTLVPDRPHDHDEIQSNRSHGFQRKRRFSVNTNTTGLRGKEFVVPASDYRIIAVGDSVTFGWGVDDDQTYPVLLEKELGIEVINAGIPGLSPVEAMNWTQQNAKLLDGDLVVMMFAGYGQELVLSRLKTLQKYLDPIQIIWVVSPDSTFAMKPNNPEHNPELLSKRMGSIPVCDLEPIFKSAQVGKPGVVFTKEGSRQRLLDNQDGQILIEVISETPRNIDDEILAAFEKDTTLREPLFFDGGHPDEEGYALMAQSVAACVRQFDSLD